jgi:hypothetical protein
VRQNLELHGQIVRLSSWWMNSRAARTIWAPWCTGGDGKFRPGSKFLKENYVMRSDLVFGALSHVSNRYQLCQLASKATRKLHKPNTRVQDTANEVLARFHTVNPGSAAPFPESAEQPVETRRAA